MALIAALDFFSGGRHSVGWLYVFPLLLAATHLDWFESLATAFLASGLMMQLAAPSWSLPWFARFSVVFFLFGSSGLFIVEFMRRLQGQLRSGIEAANYQARTILNCSPAAILVVSEGGRIETANDEARRLLTLPPDSSGQLSIGRYFPTLANVLESQARIPPVRSMIECRGMNTAGESFFAQMWLSSIQVPSGAKFVLVVTDASEHLREREDLGLQQLLLSSSIIAGAVSHEIKSLAAAASVLYARLGEKADLAASPEFQALAAVLEAQRKLASPSPPAELLHSSSGLDVAAFLEEFRIIASSADFQGTMDWCVAADLPRVRAEHSALLQVMLNLVRNSQRALANVPEALIRIRVYTLEGSVLISLFDNGPGIQQPESLFQPFQAGAHSTGLGLYVSRAIIRTFGGELRYDVKTPGAHFVIQLPVIPHEPAGA